MEKQCIKCGIKKSVTEFSPHKSTIDRLQSSCKDCRKAYQAQWYTDNKKVHRARCDKVRKKLIRENRRKLWEYYQTHPCIDCGETRPECLDFDHVRGKKRKIVSKLLASSWTIIQAEIDKCEVRCANCHRVKTAKQFGWYKSWK